MKKNKLPKLSIITINLNNLTGLQQTMESVFGQTFSDYEYIIIDGGSTDGSKGYIQQESDKLAYWVSEKDSGIYDAMNKGIAIAQGEYLMFLNSGDYLVRNNVLSLASEHINNEIADIFYGNIIIEREKGNPVSKRHAEKLTIDILEKETINHQASFIKSNLFQELGLYNLHYTLAADHAFFMKALINGKKFHHIDVDWVFYQLDGITSLNAEKYWIQMSEISESIPQFIKELRDENNQYRSLMDQRIMKLAYYFNGKYQYIRKVLRKK